MRASSQTVCAQGRRREAPRFPGAASAVPGVVVSLLVAGLAWAGSLVLGGISPLLIAIVVGVVWRNVAPVPGVLSPGFAIASKPLLRIGIVLLGLQIPLQSVLGLGPGVLAIVVLSVGVTFFATLWIGHLMGISVAQRILIASGFSICGAAAVAGVDGVTRAKEEEVATAIALVVLFGTLMIPLMPFLTGILAMNEQNAGTWIGAATHEVAQVVAAGGAVGGGALNVAVTVKLSRVLLLAPIAAGVSLYARRAMGAQTDGDLPSGREAKAPKRPPLVPLFILGFIAAMLVRTLVPLPTAVLDVAQIVQTVLLSAAMFALGLGVHIKSLIRVGARPLLLGLSATLIIMAVSLCGIWALGA